MNDHTLYARAVDAVRTHASAHETELEARVAELRTQYLAELRAAIQGDGSDPVAAVLAHRIEIDSDGYSVIPDEIRPLLLASIAARLHPTRRFGSVKIYSDASAITLSAFASDPSFATGESLRDAIQALARYRKIQTWRTLWSALHMQARDSRKRARKAIRAALAAGVSREELSEAADTYAAAIACDIPELASEAATLAYMRRVDRLFADARKGEL